MRRVAASNGSLCVLSSPSPDVWLNGRQFTAYRPVRPQSIATRQKLRPVPRAPVRGGPRDTQPPPLVAAPAPAPATAQRLMYARSHGELATGQRLKEAAAAQVFPHGPAARRWPSQRCGPAHPDLAWTQWTHQGGVSRLGLNRRAAER